MGWWSSGKHGGIAGALDDPVDSGRDEYWGDGPADLMDEAIAGIVDEFEAAWGRKPYRAEFERGLQFSLGPEDVEDGGDDPAASLCRIGVCRCRRCVFTRSPGLTSAPGSRPSRQPTPPSPTRPGTLTCPRCPLLSSPPVTNSGCSGSWASASAAGPECPPSMNLI